MPSINGRMRRPDAVGLTPLTICMYSGRKVSAPNMAKPMTKPMELAALKTRSRKRGAGGGRRAGAERDEKRHPPRQPAPRPRREDALHRQPGPRDPPQA